MDFSVFKEPYEFITLRKLVKRYLVEGDIQYGGVGRS